MAREPKMCVRCGREGFAQFVPLNPTAAPEQVRFVCTAAKQCRFRQQLQWRKGQRDKGGSDGP